MELRQYGTTVLKWWWLLVLGTALSAGTGYYASRMQAPVYRASTTLLVNQMAPDSRILDYSTLMANQSLGRTYAEMIRKSPVLDATIQKLGLPYDDARLRGLVQTRVIRDTQLIEVSVDSNNPRLAQDIANTLAELFIAQRMEDQLGRTATSREILRQQIDDLERQLRTVGQALDAARASRSPESVEIARLQSELSQVQLTYSQLIKSEQDMRLTEARTLSTLKVAEPASLPRSPMSPNIPQNTIAAALIGLLVAAAAVYLVEYLDDTVKRTDDVQRLIEVATLGVVGRITPGRGSEKEPRLIAEFGPKSPIGESYRVLRVNLDFAWAGQPGQVVVITSPNPGEGKSTTLSNVAVMLAKDNRRVIMVDGDLRRPSLHRTFGMEGTAGLTNLLAEPAAKTADYLRATTIPNLSLLPSGPIPPNPAELIGSPRFRAILQELRGMADIVMLDSPPILGVADAQLICAQADGVVLVIDAGATRAHALVRASEVLSHGSARILGAVLNKLSRRSADYYYQYYYNRYYTPGSGSSNGAKTQRQDVRS